MKTPAALCSLALLTAITSAQDESDTNKPEQPPIKFQVLQSWKTDLGDRSIYLNRVLPPIIPQEGAVHARPPRPLSAEDAEIALRRKSKKSEILFLSATVYDRKVTEIRWVDGAHQFSAFSNVDFNLLGSSATVETADTVCSLLLTVGNETTGDSGSLTLSAARSEALARKAKQIPSLEKLSLTQAQYLIMEDESDVAPQAKDLAAMDALHAYFDANRQRLAEEYPRREAARIERERWLEEHPPVPTDIVINFWRKPSLLPTPEVTK